MKRSRARRARRQLEQRAQEAAFRLPQQEAPQRAQRQSWLPLRPELDEEPGPEGPAVMDQTGPPADPALPVGELQGARGAGSGGVRPCANAPRVAVSPGGAGR